MGDEDLQKDPKHQTYSFFFYGTLCHPAILTRVLRRKSEDLLFQDAVLPNYTRHHVKNEDYPAVIDYESTKSLATGTDVSSAVSGNEYSTRGTVVRGLTYADVQALDIFEGVQYSRRLLPVKTLSAPSPISSLPRALADPSVRAYPNTTSTESSASKNPKSAQTSGKVGSHPSGSSDRGDSPQGFDENKVWVYVWSDSLDHLEPKIWDFASFMQDKAHLWTGTSTHEYDDVDRMHALREEPNGTGQQVDQDPKGAYIQGEAELEGQKKEGYPDFGRGMLKHWAFKEGYLNFNHGAYGSPPLPVLKAIRALSNECESDPNKFMKKSYLPHLHRARQRVADLIGADMGEVVIVPGATHGVNNILREIEWAEGDIILSFNTTYGAVSQTIKYLTDRHRTLYSETIDLSFPLPHADILRRTEEVMEQTNVPSIPNYTGQAKPTGKNLDRRVRCMIIDQIASNPGVKYPWEELVKLCKKYGVISLVDAAHAIGQVKTDIKAVDPDFWVSNCHKWLYAHRACAAMYVPLRNQGMIRSSMPTGSGYESARYPTNGVDRHWDFASQFDWVATQDWAPFFSINSALDFREEIGGEERIMAYCNALAKTGGKRLNKRWRGCWMENEHEELTAAMVNVFLPDAPVPESMQEGFEQRKYLEERMFDANAFCAVYMHAGRWCARFSCQVWIELEDFDRIAQILEDAIRGLKEGRHRSVQVHEDETLHKKEDDPMQDA